MLFYYSFRITVDFANDNGSTPSVKQLHGQSLIDILDREYLN